MKISSPQVSRLALFLIAILSYSVILESMGHCQNESSQNTSNVRSATTLGDLSGLAWIHDGQFLACHDAKVVGENLRPRYAFLTLPKDLHGVTYRDARFSFKGRSPNDLESIAKIPGTDFVLLCESGDSKMDPKSQMIYKAEITPSDIKIVDVTQWPTLIKNVEGTAVARVGDKHIFVFAERADKQPSTELSWLELDPNTMEFKGEVQSVTVKQPDPKRYNRVIVGLDIDSDGMIYAASAFDAEAAGLPDPEDGPYAGGVFAIGSVVQHADDAAIELFAQPKVIATVDGFKVEGVAVRETGETKEIFFATDDENYGGVIRRSK